MWAALGPLWVDLVIGLTLLEGLWLWRRHRRGGRGPAPRDFAGTLLSGLCLMLALRGSLAGSGAAWILTFLFLSGCVHASDLWLRWR
jgi:uncharacterized iron-regulated membrane protein